MDREQTLYTADKAGTRSEYVAFTHVDERTFQQFYDSKLNLHSYLPQSQLLIVKMGSSAHAITNPELVEELRNKLKDMGMNVRQNLKIYAGGVVHGPDKSKEPDHKFIPRSLPQGRGPKWPSMVIEVGHSQNASQLRRDALWWIQASNGDVKLALTVHVPKDKKIVTYCLWSLSDRQIRHNKEPVAELRQQVMVKKDTNSSIVASDNLTIPFHLLFLRDPQGTETHIVLEKHTLESLAGDSLAEM
jgi:hypothetical protein